MVLKVLMYIMKVSINELFLFLFVVIFGVVIFVCLVYYMEIFFDEKFDFEYILFVFWWVFIIMIIVGYGDMILSMGFGYIVGFMCVISGVLVIVFLVFVIV